MGLESRRDEDMDRKVSAFNHEKGVKIVDRVVTSIQHIHAIVVMCMKSVKKGPRVSTDIQVRLLWAEPKLY